MKNLTTYIIKIMRISGWLCGLLVLAMTVTGYGLSGRYGLNAIISGQTAFKWHSILTFPLLILAIIHGITAFYLALRRWEWIGQKKPPQPE